METMPRIEAIAAYNAFIAASDEDNEMPFESWCEWESITVSDLDTTA